MFGHLTTEYASAMSKVIYICGPITGKPNGNKEIFQKAANWYRNRGLIVINPHDIANIVGQHEPTILREEFAQITQNVDAIALLTGWQNSRYGLVEVAIAISCGIQIIKAFSFEVLHPTLTIQADGSNRSKTLVEQDYQPEESIAPNEQMQAQRRTYGKHNRQVIQTT